MRKAICLVLTSLMFAGCSQWRGPGGQSASAPRFDGMGNHHRTVTTSSREAQGYFDQGLVWAYAFNHDEAIRSFEAAAQDDPQCAMAWWGAALCNGPHINFPFVPPDRAAAAWKALNEAKTRSTSCSPVEKELITALSARYAEPQPDDRRPLDEAYAAAMGKVWAAHRDDPDVGTLYAESLMDLQPWDLWTPTGQPKGHTTEIIGVLEAVLAIAPEHPGANHVYIHALENSPTPEKADASAERLRRAVPVSGHLTHMPSHIDVQVGRWAKASDQNEAAIEADRKYRRVATRDQGFYRVYMAHNQHFLAFAAMMEGRKEVALKAARTMVASIPASFISEHPEFADGFTVVTMEVLMRFGEWDAILREPEQPANLPVSTALYHFVRGVAYAAKGEVRSAQHEQSELRAAIAKCPKGWMININSAATILAIADHVLAGEIAYRQGRMEESIAELRKGVELEDTLLYMEPPDWIQPVRHTLGAVLVDADRFAEAEKVYREDLRSWPENGWSLHGLAVCLKARGANAEATEVEQRFAKTWSRADTKPTSSCMCVKGKRGVVAMVEMKNEK